MLRTINIILLNTIVLMVLMDNIIYSYTKNDEQMRSISFRHTINSGYKDKPSKTYIDQSNISLNKSAIDFRTGIDGAILPDGGTFKADSQTCLAVFMGGSSTENRWVEESKRWPSVTGNLLFEKGLNIKTKNFGVGGQNLHQSALRYLSYIEELNPNYVFIMHEANDISKFIKGGYYERESSLYNSYDIESLNFSLAERFKSIIKNLIPFSYQQFRFIRNKNSNPIAPVRKVSSSYEGLSASDAAKEYFSRIQVINSLLIMNEAELIFIQYPHVYKEVLSGSTKQNSNVRQNLSNEIKNNGLTNDLFLDYINDFRGELYKLLKDEGINIIIFEQGTFNEQMFYDEIHFNEFGSGLFSELLVNKIIDFIDCP